MTIPLTARLEELIRTLYPEPCECENGSGLVCGGCLGREELCVLVREVKEAAIKTARLRDTLLQIEGTRGMGWCPDCAEAIPWRDGSCMQCEGVLSEYEREDLQEWAHRALFSDLEAKE